MTSVVISRILETVGINEIPEKVERGEPRPEPQRFSMRVRGGTKTIKGNSNPKKQNKQKQINRGFPGGAVVESLPANAGDTGSSPGLGGSYMPRSN